MRSVRLFAKHLETWCECALAASPAVLREQKLTTVRMFTKALRRQTSLNHLAQAVKAVLGTGTIVQQMVRDWNRVDFDAIQAQTKLGFRQTSGEEVEKWKQCKLWGAKTEK